MSAILSTARRFSWRGLALVVTAMVLTSCGGWRGIANVPLPGGPGSGKDKMTIYVQMPDTLALNVNSRVRVADVYVGSVKNIELKNWVPTLTLDLQPDIGGRHDQLLYSAAREFVSNVVRHAGARRIEVELSRANGDVVLVVEDDGRGLDPSQLAARLADGHIGLASQRVRVESAGGRMSVVSRPGAGTRAEVRLPR